MKKNGLNLINFLIICILVSCRPVSENQIINEFEIKPLMIDDVFMQDWAEYSGLTWYQDYLILLPQYPDRFPSGHQGRLIAIHKKDLEEQLFKESKKTIPIKQIDLIAPGIYDLPGFEGFEAIAFHGDQVFVSIETEPNRIKGYIISGKMENNMKSLRLDPESLVSIEPQSNVPNMSEEALVIIDSILYSIYELNQTGINHQPVVHAFDLKLNPLPELDFPQISYRITDASSFQDSSFYVMNYFFAGRLNQHSRENDSLIIKHGQGESHARHQTVERIVKINFSEGQFSISPDAPVYLKLDNLGSSRNWEGIVRFKNGFLIITDKFPETNLAYIEL